METGKSAAAGARVCQGKNVWRKDMTGGRGSRRQPWAPAGRTGEAVLDPGQSTTGVRKACFWHLLKQRVVGAIQVELAQVVPVGKDEKWLLICRGRVLAQLWYPRLSLQQLWFPRLSPATLYQVLSLPAQAHSCLKYISPSKCPSHRSRLCSCGGHRHGARSPPHTDTCNCRGC